MDLQMQMCEHVTDTLRRSPSFKVFKRSKSQNVCNDKIRRHTPVGSGEYSVGCFDIMCDPTDKGSFFRLFYPVEKTDIYKRDKQWPLWLPRKQYGEGYADFLTKNPKVVGKLFNWMGGDVYVPALWQGPLCLSNTQFPVVIFSHGLGGNRTTNTTVCCELASQGFIVASVEHRDGSASMTYHLIEPSHKNRTESSDHNVNHKRHTIHRTHLYSEEWKPFERFEPWDDFNYRNKQVHHRADEIILALDKLERLHRGEEVHNSIRSHFNTKQFMNRLLDLSRVAVVGHSFGGSTTLCTLSRDKRFRVGVVLDGWMHPLDEKVYKEITQPVLMVNMESFQWKKNIEQMMEIIGDKWDRSMITIRGTCHQSVTDFQFLVNKALGRFLDVRYTLSPKTAMSLSNKATLGFIWKHLGIHGKELHEDILTGSNDLIILGTNVDMSK